LQTLNYGFEIKNLLRKKRMLKRSLSKKANLTPKKIAVLGGSTTAEIINILELFLLDSGIEPKFLETDYNQYFETALFDIERLMEFNPDVVFIHTSVVNILKFPQIEDDNKVINELLENELSKFQSIWDSLAKLNCLIIQNNFDLPIDRSMGNLDSVVTHGKTYFIGQLNDQFAASARHNKNLLINDINYLSAYIGLNKWFDRSLWYTSKYALSMEAIPDLAYNLANIIKSAFGLSKKCIVVDLDNTCWGGIIGDDGVQGIKVGSGDAISEAHSDFQKYIVQLKQRGIVIAVCSKNDLENAKEGFIHSESPLKIEDFSAFKANWLNKPENIKAIVDELNIGMESVVFIDDSPLERDLVRKVLPVITIPAVGDNILDYISHIDRNGYFEPTKLSTEDINRSKYYKMNAEKKRSEATFNTYEEFLDTLKMRATVQAFESTNLDRITQLINKTNQFNLTTKRYSISDISMIANNDSYISQSCSLSDKYGEHGLVSVMLGEIKDVTCNIDLWLMSCRVFKRDLEHVMMDFFIKQCLIKNVEFVVGYYVPTDKNSMVSRIYEEVGFKLIQENDCGAVFKLDVASYVNKNKRIKVLSI
jgi:FkbH-like protein